MAVTTRTFRERKAQGQRISMVTCYDATFARLVDDAGIDAVLVGDSLGMVVKGEPNTLAVSVDEMAYHVRAVARGAKNLHVVADMPFMSYQVSVDDAVRNAGRFLAAGAHSVKLEGGRSIAGTVHRLVDAGIPVMGHVGLMPQSVHAQGGFVVQGKSDASRVRILDDARALEDAGAYAIVVEGVPLAVAAEMTRSLSIPTIGIGAGVHCDGQILVLYDLLGLNPDFKPKFVKRFVEGGAIVTDALKAYAREVATGVFPGEENSFGVTTTTTVGDGKGYGPGH